MWEIIERMATDRTMDIHSILGSLVGCRIFSVL